MQKAGQFLGSLWRRLISSARSVVSIETDSAADLKVAILALRSRLGHLSLELDAFKKFYEISSKQLLDLKAEVEAERARRDLEEYKGLIARESARFEAEKTALQLAPENRMAFTVVNFNPMPLRMQGIYLRYSMPGGQDKNLPPNVKRIVLRWNGAERRGVYMTIGEPLIFGKTLGVLEAPLPLNHVVPEFFTIQEARALSPMQIAQAIRAEYSSSSTIADAAERRRFKPDIHGVTAFRGGIEELKRLGRRPLAHLKVPVMIDPGYIRRKCSLKSYPLLWHLRRVFARQIAGDREKDASR